MAYTDPEIGIEMLFLMCRLPFFVWRIRFLTRCFTSLDAPTAQSAVWRPHGSLQFAVRRVLPNKGRIQSRISAQGSTEPRPLRETVLRNPQTVDQHQHSHLHPFLRRTLQKLTIIV